MTIGGLFFVHAHPDDESASTGGTIAKYRSAGVPVCVVTCTRGEEGKVGPAGLAHLSADREDKLGDYRAGELRNALTELGVTDHHYLMGPGHFRDSGRLGRPSNDRADAFWQADLDLAGRELAQLIRQRKPQVLITYDAQGGYGHPDHIQAHRLSLRALEIAEDPAAELGEPSYRVPKVYWCAVPRAEIADSMRRLAKRASAQSYWVEFDLAAYPDAVVEPAEIAAEIELGEFWERKRAALDCHRTQMTVNGGMTVMASGRAIPILGTEWYVRARPHWTGGTRETDLLAEMDGER